MIFKKLTCCRGYGLKRIIANDQFSSPLFIFLIISFKHLMPRRLVFDTYKQVFSYLKYSIRPYAPNSVRILLNTPQATKTIRLGSIKNGSVVIAFPISFLWAKGLSLEWDLSYSGGASLSLSFDLGWWMVILRFLVSPGFLSSAALIWLLFNPSWGFFLRSVLRSSFFYLG